MKTLVSNIEIIDCLQINYDDVFILQGYEWNVEQSNEIIKNKKLKEKYQKRINKIIKNL